jgi:hypothetical protein
VDRHAQLKACVVLPDGRRHGKPVSSGSEAEAHGPEDSFELMWAGADEFDDLGLYPADVRLPLAELLSTSA